VAHPIFPDAANRGLAAVPFLVKLPSPNPKGKIMRNEKSIFFVEVTDTFAGEANYCWVHRFKVHASSFIGAVRKVRREMGLPPAKINGNYGDMVRYDFKGAAICAFIMGYEDQAERYMNVKSI
jgi:hypothetical protein